MVLIDDLCIDKKLICKTHHMLGKDKSGYGIFFFLLEHPSFSYLKHLSLSLFSNSNNYILNVTHVS